MPSEFAGPTGGGGHGRAYGEALLRLTSGDEHAAESAEGILRGETCSAYGGGAQEVREDVPTPNLDPTGGAGAEASGPKWTGRKQGAGRQGWLHKEDDHLRRELCSPGRGQAIHGPALRTDETDTEDSAAV